MSTGSTAQTIRDAGHTVTDVSDVTGFPESLDGRVKTLHPSVHAGILADLRLESHAEQLENLGIEAFQLVVVNLYPFRETVASGAPDADIIEQIDIGGPALVRASAKNHANVAITVSPARYGAIMEAVAAGGTTLSLKNVGGKPQFVSHDAAPKEGPYLRTVRTAVHHPWITLLLAIPIQRLLGLTGLAVVSRVVGVLLARSITRPLRTVQEVAARVGRGDLEARAPEGDGPPDPPIERGVVGDDVERVLPVAPAGRADRHDALRLRLDLRRAILEVEDRRGERGGGKRADADGGRGTR